MSKLPNSLIKLTSKLFDAESARKEFLNCFESPPDREQSLIWIKDNPPATTLPSFDFQPEWVERTNSEVNRTLYDEGAFYPLDSSSIFAASPLLDLPRTNIIFDACAAPGGKSVFAWRAHDPDLIISNEFVEKRLKPLISNLQRCKIKPAEVFHLSPKRVGEMFPQCFPIVMVDAPCSGQSLLLKGEKVDGAFHPQTVNGNAMRQRRILAELAPSVAPQGHLLYMTCTFSAEENEEIVRWFVKKFPQFETIEVKKLESYRSQLSDFPSYRLWPQMGKGAGSFTALLKNTDDDEPSPMPKDYKPVWRNGKI